MFGDTVNLASRLCEYAGGGQIILTEWTAKLLSPLYRGWLRKLDSAKLKGRTDEVGLCELVWRADDNATAFQRVRAEDKPAPPAVLRLKFHGMRMERRREKEVLTIGRDTASDLVVREEKASRQHCTIERRKDKFVITDVSTNGTYVTHRRREGGVPRARPSSPCASAAGSPSASRACTPPTWSSSSAARRRCGPRRSN